MYSSEKSWKHPGLNGLAHLSSGAIRLAACMVQILHPMLTFSRFIQKKANNSLKQLNILECGKLS
jgi:hypothetical protein